jgi:hypothetical protein
VGRGESEFTVVGDNKILTVSYGTFSCTLEGFDDPFSTMKNIAEYFRDLAAGDRFFGAEPPQPDPEMLQSIAEQTIKARVNAQLSDNGLVLRQDAADTPTPSVAAPIAAAAAVAPQVSSFDAAPTPGVETVAEKLQRIRAVVSRETAQDALFSEDQHVDEFAAETTAPHTAFDNAAFEDDYSSSLNAPMVEPEAKVEDINVEDVVSDEVTPKSDVEKEASIADEVADDLTPETSVSDEVLPSDLAQYDDEDDMSGDIDLASVKGNLPYEDTTEVASDDIAEVSENDGTEDVGSDTSASEEKTDDDPTVLEDAAETAVDNVLGRVTDENDDDDATPRRRIVVQKITREDLKTAREKANADAELDDTAEETADVASTLSGELAPEQEEDLLRELAALQTEGDEVAAEMTFETDPVSETSEDDEDNLSAMEGLVSASIKEDSDPESDLADALSDLVAEDAEDYQKDEQDAAREIRRARREAITEDDEDDVERLISTTSSRIDSDESSQRRASIAHLKAAVAATKADSSLTGAAQEQEARDRDQYAEDLARVVRPERKTTSGERGKTNRPAPLVLVSELRIDKDQEDDTSVETVAKEDGPVRPRRISRAEIDEKEAAADSNIFTDSDQASFADYAASANALELPDLLEAAAAYYTFVESTEQFTRPMLMRKIASISERDGHSREEGLRSFGTLLREGKLVKGSDGKFVIAKNSRFTPEARYAGE